MLQYEVFLCKYSFSIPLQNWSYLPIINSQKLWLLHAAKRARNSICSSTQQKSSFKRDLLPLCTCTASEETHAWNMVRKSRQMKIWEREREREMLHLQSFGHCQDWCIRQWPLCLQTYKRMKVSLQHLLTEDEELLPSTLSHGQVRAEWSFFSQLEENGEKVVFRLLSLDPFPAIIWNCLRLRATKPSPANLLETRNLVLILQPWFFQPISGHGA